MLLKSLANVNEEQVMLVSQFIHTTMTTSLTEGAVARMMLRWARGGYSQERILCAWLVASRSHGYFKRRGQNFQKLCGNICRCDLGSALSLLAAYYGLNVEDVLQYNLQKECSDKASFACLH
eukprot:6172196-Pleurochrysis_carterae.AAC.1